VSSHDVSPAVESSANAQLLSLASHELRTPLSVLTGYLRMLQQQDNGTLGELQRKMIAEAQKSCERLTALVGELSDMSKLETGAAVMRNEPVDLFETLEAVAASVDEGRDRDVHLAFTGESSGATLVGDPVRLRAAFAAIFRAVLREQPGACTVVVYRQLSRNADTPVATVVVAHEAQSQRARQSPPARFNEYRGGLGLLLPIARSVIARHGGRIWSPADADAASAIAVSLPLEKAQAQFPELKH
jgi:two-component system sensor histidine kinase KdpD